MHKFTGAHCPKPRPFNSLITQGKSKEELSVYNFLQLELPYSKIISGDRALLGNGREVDIYIPEFRLGIEYEGIRFHSEDAGRTEDYHLDKTNRAEARGLRLISLFSDEWLLKKPITADLLRKAIGKYQEIDVEDCELLPITNKEAEVFFKNNYLLPSKPGDYNLGLFYQNNLVAACTIDNGVNSWIINRYCECRSIVVNNGLNPIINYIKNIQNKPIATMLDRRLFDGYEFKQVGFKEIYHTKPNYTLTEDYQHRYYPDELSLQESESSKYHKVWDCGNRIFRLN